MLSCIQQQLLSTAASVQWQKVGIQQHHGINVPLFSLHSSQSGGIGEYPDLIPLFKWCQEVGFNIIQLLPLNDTGTDTSPYSAISANALNPLHLGLSHLPDISQDSQLMLQLAALQKLNTSQRIDYPAVRKGKERFLRDYFESHAAAPQIASDEYQTFKNSHSWLMGYALFKALKIQNNWQSWEKWTAPWNDPSLINLADLSPTLKHEVELHIFVQFLCFKQMVEVKQQAIRHNILLKGDIPILINRDSADVWLNRRLFLLQYSAGAPPDMYAEEGQKWGFPIYNWPEHANEYYYWWIERLKVAARCYHIYRIDHIVGFYRIWAIPLGSKAKEGQFIPLERALWIPQGDQLMQMMLANCDMLPIGEDLGTIPPEVRINLKKLGICGTKVMRWERRWLTDQGFINLSDYPAESMTTVSTHDSETLQQWWKNQAAEAQLYAKTVGLSYAPNLTLTQRFEILRASHHSASLFHINLLQEYLALNPELIWSNPDDERINIPGTITDINWTYRFKPSIEELVNNQDFKILLSKILT